MKSPENITETQVPSIDAISQKTWETVKDMAEFVVEWIPQMEACVDRHQEAMNTFCIHEEVWLFSFDSTKDLLSS